MLFVIATVFVIPIVPTNPNYYHMLQLYTIVEIIVMLSSLV